MPFIIAANEEIIFLIDLTICLIAGFLLGMERESRGKAAGISTHILVIAGSMLFTFLSVRVDPTSTSRIAAQIITGIGFLGAGLIIKEGVSVINLTTAASVWYSAAIGMAVGFGYYIVAITATIAAFFIPRIPHFNRHLEPTTKKVYYKFENRKPEDDPFYGIKKM